MVEVVISGQDSYLSFYVKTHCAKKLTTLTDDGQITRLSKFVILTEGYIMITYYSKETIYGSHHSEQ